AARGVEAVERLVAPVAVRIAASTRQIFARKRRRLLPALADLRMLGDARASAVLGVQPCGVEPGHEGSSEIGTKATVRFLTGTAAMRYPVEAKSVASFAKLPVAVGG